MGSPWWNAQILEVSFAIFSFRIIYIIYIYIYIICWRNNRLSTRRDVIMTTLIKPSNLWVGTTTITKRSRGWVNYYIKSNNWVKERPAKANDFGAQIVPCVWPALSKLTWCCSPYDLMAGEGVAWSNFWQCHYHLQTCWGMLLVFLSGVFYSEQKSENSEKSTMSSNLKSI